MGANQSLPKITPQDKAILECVHLYKLRELLCLTPW